MNFGRILVDLWRLLQLQPNWDSYGARTIRLSCAARALFVYLSLRAASCPWVVPTNDGGIQLEWHQNGEDLEIEIRPNRVPGLYFWNGREDDEIAAPLSRHLSFARGRLAAA